MGDRQQAAATVAAEAAGHVLLVGYGPGGRRVSEALGGLGREIVVIESDPDRAARAKREGRAVIEGDARDLAVLREARAQLSEVVAITTAQLDERVIHAVRRVRPEGVILTNAPKGFAEADDTAGMIQRMFRVLGQSPPGRAWVE